MNYLRSSCAMIVASLVVGGCAVTTLEPVAQNIRMISEQESKSCRFISTITTNNRNTLSENPEEDARNQAFNRAAEQKGNAIRVLGTNVSPARSGVGSILSMTSEIYSCGSAPMSPAVDAAPPVQAPRESASKGVADPFGMKDAQRVLNSKGYDTGMPDGVGGKKTKAAIERFQRDNGLGVTGVLNAETKALLQSLK